MKRGMQTCQEPPRRRELREEAGDRSRTGDLQLGKLTLYQLSYARMLGGTLSAGPPSAGGPGARGHHGPKPRHVLLRVGREGLEPPTSAM